MCGTNIQHRPAHNLPLIGSDPSILLHWMQLTDKNRRLYMWNRTLGFSLRDIATLKTYQLFKIKRTICFFCQENAVPGPERPGPDIVCGSNYSATRLPLPWRDTKSWPRILHGDSLIWLRATARSFHIQKGRHIGVVQRMLCPASMAETW